jgi:hypothetical protein
MALIKKSDVTKEKISELLNAAGIETIVDEEDGSVYAKPDGIDFGVFVKFDEERSRIRLFTYVQCKQGTTGEALHDFLSKLNEEYILVRFSKTEYEDGRTYLNGDYDYLYTFGLVAENFLATIKKFASVYIDAIRTEDQDDVFFG